MAKFLETERLEESVCLPRRAKHCLRSAQADLPRLFSVSYVSEPLRTHAPSLFWSTWSKVWTQYLRASANENNDKVHDAVEALQSEGVARLLLKSSVRAGKLGADSKTQRGRSTKNGGAGGSEEH